MPYAMTGPAILKRFAPTPKIYPSALNSREGDTTELAKPVMGTSVPAPARLAILSNTPSPVSNTARATSVTDTSVALSSRSMPHTSPYTNESSWAKAQMPPPTQNAQTQSFYTCRKPNAGFGKI